MTTGTVTEVLIGTGTLYYDDNDGSEAAYPINPTLAPAVGWTDVGYSEEGWTAEVDKSFADVEVAEEVDPIAVLKTNQAIRLAGAFAQASLDRFRIAMGGGTIATATPAVGFDTYTPPTTTERSEFQLLFRTSAPGTAAQDFKRDWQFPRTGATGAISMPHRKAPDKTLIGVEFRAFIPVSGSIFSIIDQTL